METFFQRIGLALLVVWVFSPHTAWAYKTHTHQGITKAIVESYTDITGAAFSSAEVEALLDGSLEEDEGTRPLQHFYNPATGLGLSILKTFQASPEWAEDTLAQGNYCTWGFCQERIGYKDKYFSSKTDHSWERAVFEYVHGDKARAMETLGHILHLIEDTTVPAHVRNDQHLNHQGVGDADPYEEYSGTFGVEDVSARAKKVIPFKDLRTIFESSAGYTNQHFLSKDTFFTKLALPKKEDAIVRGDFAYSEKTGRKVAYIEKVVNKETREEFVAWLPDNKTFSVAADNWAALSQKAVESGVSVLNLFFREVEVEKKTHALLDKNKSEFEKQPAQLAKAGFNLVKGLYGSSLAQSDVEDLLGQGAAAAAAVGLPDGTAEQTLETTLPSTGATAENTSVQKEVVETISTTPSVGSTDQNPAPRQIEIPAENPTPTTHPSPPPTQTQEPTSTPGSGLFEVTPGASQSGGTATAQTAPAVDTISPPAPTITVPTFPVVIATTTITIEGTAEVGSIVSVTHPRAGAPHTETVSATAGTWRITISLEENDNPLSVTATDMAGNVSDRLSVVAHVDLSPAAPVIIIPTRGAYLATTTVAVSGTAIPTSTVRLAHTAGTTDVVSDIDGTWSATLVLSEGVNTLSAITIDADERESNPTNSSVTVDVTPPGATTISVDVCAYSLTPAFCFLATTTVDLVWEDVVDAAYYALWSGDVLVGTTTATTSASTLANTATTTFMIVVSDVAGNSATSSAFEMYAYTQPIVINEIAWAGTKAGVMDQWVELKNLSPFSIDISTVALAIEGVSQALSGTLGPSDGVASNNDLALIEVHSGATTADHTAIVAIALPTTGARLSLVHAGTIIDATPSVSVCGGWCAGSANGSLGTTAAGDAASAPLSMERNTDTINGGEASVWHSNDTYVISASDSAGNPVYGTPGRENSNGYSDVGWYCGTDDVVKDGTTYTPGSTSCTYLSGFINASANRYGGVYKGSLGNAIEVSGHSLGKARLRADQNDVFVAPTTGEQYFTALWEVRTGPLFNDVSDFHQWFQTGTTTTGNTEPPHTNYRIIEWVYGG